MQKNKQWFLYHRISFKFEGIATGKKVCTCKGHSKYMDRAECTNHSKTLTTTLVPSSPSRTNSTSQVFRRDQRRAPFVA